ncbi:MAG: hypothetical protein ABII12_03675 [Planctomycetota bacterium]
MSKACRECNGTGVHRNARHFFYAVALMASGALVFLQWPPIPTVIGWFERAAAAVGLKAEIGTIVIWLLAGVPAIFGVAFLYLWFSQDTCPQCGGSGQSTRTS